MNFENEQKVIEARVKALYERIKEDPEGCGVEIEIRMDRGPSMSLGGWKSKVHDLRVDWMEAAAREVCGDGWDWDVIEMVGGEPVFVLQSRRV